MATNGRPFAVFDIDGTLIRWQLYHSIADTLARLGHIEPKLYQQIKDARMVWKRRAKDTSFADYERQVIQVYDDTVKKLTKPQFEAAAQAVFEEYKDQTYTYTRRLIADLKQKNYLLFAISGSQTEIVTKIANYYGFDDCRGSAYEYKGGRYTGVKDVASFNKDIVLKELVEKHNAVYADSVGVGDSHSDISMLELVDLPIAFNPEKRFFKHSYEQGWKIVVERKNMIYELEKHNGKYQLAAPNQG
jgi:HAD superfamily hydrolase (TIGR01490 family)